jgi:hypothetical protein
MTHSIPNNNFDAEVQSMLPEQGNNYHLAGKAWDSPWMCINMLLIYVHSGWYIICMTYPHATHLLQGRENAIQQPMERAEVCCEHDYQLPHSYYTHVLTTIVLTTTVLITTVLTTIV